MLSKRCNTKKASKWRPFLWLLLPEDQRPSIHQSNLHKTHIKQQIPRAKLGDASKAAPLELLQNDVASARRKGRII